MSGRRPYRDSEKPDLWSNGSVFMGPREPIPIDPSPHIPLQQTTATADCTDVGLTARSYRSARMTVEIVCRLGCPRAFTCIHCATRFNLIATCCRSRPDSHNTGGPRRCPCCRNIRFKLPPIGEVRPCAGWARDARFERGTIPLGPFSADLETDRPYEVAVLHLESQIVQRRAVDPDARKLEAVIRI
jgi:hypothetical protein